MARRADLLGAGLSRADIDAEIDAERWHRLGWHTVGVDVRVPLGPARWWWAIWESGPGAVLDGVTALQAAGLRSWTAGQVDISVRAGNRVHPLDGVTLHRPRRLGPVVSGGLRRVRPELAVLRAAEWARSDRAAMTLVAMTVQQRLVPGDRVLAHWAAVRRSRRRAVLHDVIRDVCDGAHSLGELDLSRMCRRRGLPGPSRQVLRTGAAGTVHLDVRWERFGVHVEVNGVQHGLGMAPVHDALRQNDQAVDGDRSLVVPVLGPRLYPDAFLDQIERALRFGGWRGPG